MQVFTTSYNPQTNEQCERFNRMIFGEMRHCISDNQDNWNELSYTATYAYSMTVNSSTGYAPFELTPRSTPSHIVKNDLEYWIQSSDITKSLYIKQLLAECERIGQAAKEKLNQAQERY
jgi:hypothetical protein